MILQSLDPASRWHWTPPGQDALPTERRAVCECRFPTVRQYLAIARLRKESETAPGDTGYVDKLREALSQVVVAVRIGATETPGPDALLDVATPIVLWGWVLNLTTACQNAEADLGKSESPSRGAAEPSARAVVAAELNGAAHA